MSVMTGCVKAAVFVGLCLISLAHSKPLVETKDIGMTTPCTSNCFFFSPNIPIFWACSYSGNVHEVRIFLILFQGPPRTRDIRNARQKKVVVVTPLKKKVKKAVQILNKQKVPLIDRSVRRSKGRLSNFGQN